MPVVATAGHVDHGKSTLVHHLTGTDPDRLVEEKRRGLTIDLGFATAVLGSGVEVGFVDVPGHARFIKNMLAGVGAVDACLFVVAANEGWRQQSEEHLRVLQLLGISHGVLALTKAGLVDDEWLELVRLEIAEAVEGTFLEGVEMVAVDVPAGIGLDGPDGLVAAIGRMLDSTPPPPDAGRARLWVDRSFSLAGPGTVVTGTLTGGSLGLGETMAILPGWSKARVRGLHSHGRPLEVAAPGRRLAVNLAGASYRDIRRGQALVREDRWHRCSVLDASLHVLDGLGREVTRRGAYVGYFGSGEHRVRLSVLGPTSSIPAGATGLVRLRLPVALPLVPGDRFVLRESGRVETVGGGEVLDVAPVLPPSRAAPTRSVDRVVAERGWVEVDDLERLTGERREATLLGCVVDPGALAAVEAEVRRAVGATGGAGLDVALLSGRQRAVLARLTDLSLEWDGRVRRRDLPRDASALEGHPFLVALRAAPFMPPPPDDFDRGEIRSLERQGLVVEASGGIWFAISAVEEAARVVAGLLAGSPDGVTTSAIREALGTTRRYALPLLGRLDASGITRRRGDLRIGGPRLPAPGTVGP